MATVDTLLADTIPAEEERIDSEFRMVFPEGAYLALRDAGALMILAALAQVKLS